MFYDTSGFKGMLFGPKSTPLQPPVYVFLNIICFDECIFLVCFSKNMCYFLFTLGFSAAVYDTFQDLRHARWTKGRVEVKEKVETAARKHCNNALSK